MIDTLKSELKTQGGFPPVPSINYHLWKPCNMKCKFCFATFDDISKSILPKGHLPEEETLQVIHEIGQYGFEKITFVGGEPLLCPWLDELLAEAKAFGLTTMIVSNGSRLTQDWLQKNREFIDWFTLSIDSLDPEVNLKSGRAVTGRRVLHEAEVLERIDWIKSCGIKLKLNTVVHHYNAEEDMTRLIEAAQPERWKIFQVLPIELQNSGSVDEFLITDETFQAYVDRHEHLNEICPVVPETNNDMTSSYLMVDPAGRFFENSTGRLKYSSPILEVGMKAALSETSIDIEKFHQRGGKYAWN